jgi:hypothetical protein
MSGEKKIVQTPPTMKFTPRSDVAPEGMFDLILPSSSTLIAMSIYIGWTIKLYLWGPIKKTFLIIAKIKI